MKLHFRFYAFIINYIYAHIYPENKEEIHGREKQEKQIVSYPLFYNTSSCILSITSSLQ